MTEMPALGFIGTGAMGGRMAIHLVRAGYRLAVFDRRPEAAAGLLAAGAGWAESPAAVARASEIVFTCLPGPAEIEAVVLGEGGVLGELRPGCVYVDLSTNSPTLIRRIYGVGRERRVEVLDAPVSGGLFGAEVKRLTLMVGGDAATLERCRPVFEAFTDTIVHCGPAGTGATTKIANNLILHTVTMVLGETLTLAVKAGVDLGKLVEVIGTSSGQTWVMQELMARQLFRGNLSGGFPVDLAHKDVWLGTQLADELGLSLPYARLAEEHFAAAQRRGWGGLNGDAAVKLFEEEAGVELRLPE